MFQVLGSRLQDVFGSLRREVRLTPEAVERTLREIRLALLEADVNFKVVKAFIDRVRDRATERAVLDSLTPSQQVVAIVRDELLRLFGESRAGLATTTERPQVVLLVGLQGSGKTTTTAKLGRWLTGQGRHPILVSTDVRRPAAIEQLAVLGRDAGLRVHDAGTDDPVRRATSAVSEARQLGFDVVLVDTAGRLHVDDELMQEIVAIRDAVAPSDTLFVADAMTGQDAVRSAGEFNHRLGVTGAVLTKLDGDARGGAALSVVSVVGVPVVFAATGERVGDLEPFRPERLVSRLLGMGDVLSLVERAEQAITRDDAASMATRMRRNRAHARRPEAADGRRRSDGTAESGPRYDSGARFADPRGGCRCERADPHGGHHRFDDGAGAAKPGSHERRPAAPRRAGQRHDRAGREPATEAVRGDAEDVEDRRWAEPAKRAAAAPGVADHAMMPRAASCGFAPVEREAKERGC